MNKEKLFTTIAIAAAFLQTITSVTLLPFPIVNGITTTVLLTIVAVYTIKKQRTSVEVNDDVAKKYTWILIAIAIGGGVNDMLGIVHFSASLDVTLKTIVSASIGLLNIVSKNLFPTIEGRIMNTTEAQLTSAENANRSLKKTLNK